MDIVKWRKSSRSGNGGADCVEVARIPHEIVARDSKAPDHGTSRFAPHVFEAFLAEIKQGQHDI